MPRWLLITIITILGLAGAFGAYLLTTQQLDREHERYIRGLVVTYGQKQESENTPNTNKTATSTNDTQNSPLINTEQSIIASGTAVTIDEPGDMTSSFLDFSVEIGSITIDEVLFEVGMSWTNENNTETYTVTKIIQKTSGVDLFYETTDGTAYVFQMSQNPSGSGFSIVGAPPTITVSVNTDPNNTDEGNAPTDSTPTTTDPNTATQTDPESNPTDNEGVTTTPGDDTDDDTDYVVIYTSTTTEPTDSEPTPDPDPTPNPDPSPDPDPTPDPVEDNTSTSTEPVSLTSPTSTPSSEPATTSTQSQPYNDGTHQYKADAQYVPYDPPLYDRDNDDEIGVAP